MTNREELERLTSLVATNKTDWIDAFYFEEINRLLVEMGYVKALS